MERSKHSFLFAGFVAVALVLVLVSARKPLPAGGRAAMDPNAATTDLMAAAAAPKPISWLTVEEAAAKLQQEQKPVLIDLYTTWCGWCKQMDRKTYSNKQVSAYLSDKFYSVKLDAETHNTVNWEGKTYQFDPQYRCNMFAVYLSHGRLEFPTTIIIAPGFEPQAIPGYMEPKEIEMLVKYFGEGAYRKQSFDDYQKSFRGSW
jgi:thioredoxin-related protein